MIRSEAHFDEHISELCKKARRKVCTLSNVTTYVNILEERTFMNNFLHLNLVVALSYGCVVVVLTIRKDFMKVAYK